MKVNQMNSVKSTENVLFIWLKIRTKISFRKIHLVDFFQPDEKSIGWHYENISSTLELNEEPTKMKTNSDVLGT